MLVSVNRGDENEDYNEYMANLRELQRSGEVPAEDMITIFEPIVSPYSPIDHKEYYPGVFRDRWTLQILEQADKVIVEIFYNIRYNSKLEKLAMIANVCQQLFQMYTRIYEAGYSYGDTNPDNIGIIEGTVVMIDLTVDNNPHGLALSDTKQKRFEQVDEDIIDRLRAPLWGGSVDDPNIKRAVSTGMWKDLPYLPFILNDEEETFIQDSIADLVAISLKEERDYMIYDVFRTLY